MGLAQDLLAQAHHLADYEGANPSQAALRRSVSTGYYALIHLLIGEAGLHWSGSSPAAQTGLERAFSHRLMSSSSAQFSNSLWKDWHGVVQPIPTELQAVARAFVNIQQQRHNADYNNSQVWSPSGVRTVLDIVDAAFASWLSIRDHPLAGDYLLLMLVGKQR